MVQHTDRKAAFLATNGFCEREYLQAQSSVVDLGFNCRLISVDNNLIKGWNEIENKADSDWGLGYAPDKLINEALSSDYDLLVLPGGIRNIEKLKLSPNLKSFISAFITTEKPVLAYNRAIDLLYYTDLLSGYELALNENDISTLSSGRTIEQNSKFVVSKNLMTIAGFPDAGEDIKSAILSIMDNKSKAA